MPEQTSAGSGSFLQYLAGNLRRNGRSPVRVYTGFVIAWALFFLFWTVLPPFPGLTHNGMAVLGIVSFPGTMIGQILGGSMPEVAIKYQLMISVITVVASMLSLVITISLSVRRTFDEFGRLKPIFRKGRNTK